MRLLPELLEEELLEEVLSFAEERLEEDTPELPELLLLSTELLAGAEFLLPELRSTVPLLRAGRLSAFGASVLVEEALSGAVEREDSIALPGLEALSGAVLREDSILLSEVAALSGAREVLPVVAALSGAAEREDSTLLSEYPLEPELLLAGVATRAGR